MGPFIIVALWASGCPIVNTISDSDSEQAIETGKEWIPTYGVYKYNIHTTIKDALSRQFEFTLYTIKQFYILKKMRTK